jgi:hypothetical protein
VPPATTETKYADRVLTSGVPPVYNPDQMNRQCQVYVAWRDEDGVVVTAQEQRKTEAEWLAHIAATLKGLQHGSLEIIVQDSRIIQINRTEKIRVAKKLLT